MSVDTQKNKITDGIILDLAVDRVFTRVLSAGVYDMMDNNAPDMLSIAMEQQSEPVGYLVFC